jgi:magnesium chelatase accessory protein
MLPGRIAPRDMFPAGISGIRTRMATLAGGLRLRVAEAGRADAPPVLLLHGWGASIYMWRSWLLPLAGAEWRAIAVDLPGHGLSDKPRDDAVYSLAGQLAVVRALLDEMQLDGVHVVAQSMAGTIALELALAGEHRLGRIVLVNPAAFGCVPIQPLARAVSPALIDGVLPRLVARGLVARAHRSVYGDPSRITARDVDEYWAPSQFPAYAPAMRRLLHRFRWSRLPVDTMAERLRALPSPILVVLGGADRLVRDAQRYVAALRERGAPLIVRAIPGRGHAVNEECPKEVLAMTLSFLRTGLVESIPEES